ncbi:hypothetical protein FRC04_007265 [Tulasnella sp. 424]|nr:hypothetical protein FRC04_007265 [Tulasnella sp. 424]KAG8976196.1 hypothetical protein FRC05_004445 [Tulasnella sp. 425]
MTSATAVLVPSGPFTVDPNLHNTVVHPDFDFADSNVVLAVTGGPVIQTPEVERDLNDEMERLSKPAMVTTLFKVHLFQLSRHSDVLLNTLHVSVASFPISTVEGLPVIQLDDDPFDILNLLNFIYNSDILPTLPFRQDTFNIRSSILRLAPKYNLKRLSPIAKRRILEEWPTDIKWWDRNEKQLNVLCEWNALVRQADEVGQHHEEEEVDIVEPCAVIRLGAACGIPDVLPSAFYDLSRLSTIYDRVPRGQNDSSGYQRSQSYWLDGGRSANRELLTSDDFWKLYVGKAEIRRWVEEFMNSGWKSERLSGCPGADLGCAAKSDGWKAYWSREVEPCIVDLLQEDGMDVLDWLQRAHYYVGEDEQLCGDCRGRIGEVMELARAKFWKALPEFFQLKTPRFWGGEWTDESENYET